MEYVKLSFKACAQVFAILALLALSGLSQAFAYQEDSTEVTVVAGGDTQLTDDVITGGDFNECAPPAREQGLFCNHACCNVQASGPTSSFDDDQAAVIAQPGAPVPRRIEIRRIASAAPVPIFAPPRFLFFGNFRK